MADISQLEVNGTTYDICDATARDSLSNYVNSLFVTKEYTLVVSDYKTSAGLANVKYDLRLDGYIPVGFFWSTNHAYSVSLWQTNVKANDYSWIVLNIGTYFDDLTVTLRVVYAKKSA